jgi:sucrose-6-phosphate hydrolase SacC (GH32 family)
MLLYGPEENSVRYYTFFTSDNLLKWEKGQSIPGFFECPDMFELPVDNNANEKKWVIINGDGRYCLGDFDGKEFRQETGLLSVDYGRNFWATMTWGEGMPGISRRIQVTWMRYMEKVVLDMPFNQQHSYPCDLTLHKTTDGIRLFREPIPEISKLYKKSHRFDSGNVKEGDTNYFTEINDSVIDMSVEFDLEHSNCSRFILSVRGHFITCDMQEHKLNILGCPYVFAKGQKDLRLRVLSDKLSIEVFVDGGRASFTNMAMPVDAIAPLNLRVDGGQLHIKEASVNEIKSMWE